jgi:phosphoglycerol transferase MdoB-like AlkP superfamily enzyme
MAKLSIAYGVFFILMGLYSYFGISSESITALIPTFFGIPMLIFGWLGLKEKYLKHTMHGAAVLTLLGFAGTVSWLIKFFKMLGGTETARPAAVTVQAIMAVLCLVFLVFAVKSFINVRKNREKSE